MKSTSLQRILLLPFVLLVIFLAVTIGGLSYRSNEHAADEFSKRVVMDIVTRIKQSTEAHLTNSYLALKAVAPLALTHDGKEAEFALPKDLDRLEERLWIATGFFAGQGSVYFGRPDGAFIGLSRSADKAELRLRRAVGTDRNVYQTEAPSHKGALLRSHPYDTTGQLWYSQAVIQGAANWSPVYTDMNTMLPTLTLSKPVYGEQGLLEGVVAADLSLRELEEFFKHINVSRNGVAFIVDRAGAIIATSSAEMARAVGALDQPAVEAADRKSTLLHQAYGDIRSLVDAKTDLTTPIVRPMEGEGGMVHLAVAKLDKALGLDWTIVVAVPRADFMGSATRNLYQSFAIGLVALVIALGAGLTVLRRILRDIRKLTTAAQKIERGEPVDALDISRTDELGQLAQSFIEMENGLRTDRLTGVLNRGSLVTRIILRQHSAVPEFPLAFSLLFIDLDRFKPINDLYGHEAGDLVLIQIAKRMTQMLRAEDMVARFGGDEFVVYLHGVSSAAHVAPIMEKLRAVVAQPTRLQNGVMEHVTASVGAAHYPADSDNIESLLNIADTRMFEAKKERQYERIA